MKDKKPTFLGIELSLEVDRYLFSRPYVFTTNVNAANPGVRGRGSKGPNRREATITAYEALRLKEAVKSILTFVRANAQV